MAWFCDEGRWEDLGSDLLARSVPEIRSLKGAVVERVFLLQMPGWTLVCCVVSCG